jgi:hypothetical protein
MKRKLSPVIAILACFLYLGAAIAQESDSANWIALFDGKSLRGWHVSPLSGHSAVSGNKSGGRWVVEDGAIVGSQDQPGNGGIILTDETFGSFEVVLEMNNDFGPDSGLFLRSTEDGKAYQAMIDYHPDGNLMGVYGEGLGGQPAIVNFRFGASPETITPDDEGNPLVPLPVSPEDWPDHWRAGQWNELRARITGGERPTITTWINGVKFCEWTETESRHPAQGHIGLQVHGGGDDTDYRDKFVRYRNIRVKRLD